MFAIRGMKPLVMKLDSKKQNTQHRPWSAAFQSAMLRLSSRVSLSGGGVGEFELQ